MARTRQIERRVLPGSLAVAAGAAGLFVVDVFGVALAALLAGNLLAEDIRHQAGSMTQSKPHRPIPNILKGRGMKRRESFPVLVTGTVGCRHPGAVAVPAGG